MKIILVLILAIMLSCCSVYSDAYLRQFLGRDKHFAELEFGKPYKCDTDSYGEICEFTDYNQNVGTIYLRFYFDTYGKCYQIKTW
jgi:hypothetical protein